MPVRFSRPLSARLAFAGILLFGALPARADVAGECAASYESAQRFRRAGQLQSAHSALLRCSRAECPAFVATDCATWLVEVDAEQPTLVFVIRDALGRDALGAQLVIDGIAVTVADTGLPHPLDPGAHEVVVRWRGRELNEHIVVRSGERGRRLDLRFPPIEQAGAGDVRPVPAYVFIVGASSVVLGGIGAGLWLDGTNNANEYNRSCSNRTPGCSQDERSSVRSELVAGDILIGAAASAAILAAVLFLTRPSQLVQPSALVGARNGTVTGLGVRF